MGVRQNICAGSLIRGKLVVIWRLKKDQIVPQVTKFKYLGSITQNNGEIDEEVTYRIQARWCK